MLRRLDLLLAFALGISAGSAHAFVGSDKVFIRLNENEKQQGSVWSHGSRLVRMSCSQSWYNTTLNFQLKNDAGSTVRELQVQFEAQQTKAPNHFDLSNGSFRYTVSDRSDTFSPGVAQETYPYDGHPASECEVTLSEYNPAHPTVKPDPYSSQKIGQLRGRISCSRLRYIGSYSGKMVEGAVEFSRPISY